MVTKTKTEGRWTASIVKITDEFFGFEQKRNDLSPANPPAKDEITLFQLGLIVNGDTLIDYEGSHILSKMALDMLRDEGVLVEDHWYDYIRNLA